jgi:uncharacterized protein with FMN-binding domain
MRKKIIALALSIGVAGAIILDVFYVFFFKADQSNLTTSSIPSTQQENEDATTSSAEKAATGSSAGSQTYVDGKYTGLSTATSWGQLQLRIEIENGKLVEIDVLEYPDDNARDIQINEQALPLYKSRAIEAQSSDITAISGATETYKGFTGSLQDALDQAQTGVERDD